MMPEEQEGMEWKEQGPRWPAPVESSTTSWQPWIPLLSCGVCQVWAHHHLQLHHHHADQRQLAEPGRDHYLWENLLHHQGLHQWQGHHCQGHQQHEGQKWGYIYASNNYLFLLEYIKILRDRSVLLTFEYPVITLRSHIHLSSVFFNLCSSSQLSKSTTFRPAMAASMSPVWYWLKMRGQPTGSTITVPHVLIVFEPSTFHIFCRTNIILRIIARAEYVINYIWCGAI